MSKTVQKPLRPRRATLELESPDHAWVVACRRHREDLMADRLKMDDKGRYPSAPRLAKFMESEAT